MIDDATLEPRDFLATLFEGMEGRTFLSLPDSYGNLNENHWFTVPDDLKKMNAFAGAHYIQGVHYSPMIYEGDKATNYNSKLTRALTVDADDFNVSNFRLQPNIIVETSPNRHQVVFLLDKPYDSHEVSKIARRINLTHEDEGCDNVFQNPAKRMRLPGTQNEKHPGNFVWIEDSDISFRYSLEEIANTYTIDDVPDRADFDIEYEEMPDNILDYVDAERANLLGQIYPGSERSNRIQDLLFTENYGGRRSEMLYLLLLELFRYGFDAMDVTALVWPTKLCSKWRLERTVQEFWDQDLMKARAEVKSEAENDKTPNENEKIELPAPKERVVNSEVPLLKPGEEDFLDTNFIERWVDWAATKSDGLPQFNRAAGTMLLATVLSEFGCATPSWGDTKLNMWMMILGRSTQDRKSQSRSYLHKAIHQLSDGFEGGEYDYFIGGDSTPSGLSMVLSERANKSSLYSRDEGQDWFNELFGQTYQSGMIGIFSSLYDGTTPGRVRASGEKKRSPSVEVSFNMLITGILSETTDTLTAKHFKNGFLARFLYAIGERPPGWKAPRAKQQSEKEAKRGDDEFNKLVDEVRDLRHFWMMRQPVEGSLIKIRCTDEAWDRWCQMDEDLLGYAKKHRIGELLEPTYGRMAISALKLATILAMAEKKSHVQMKHMIQAISYCEEWAKNAIVVASQVSDSEWGKEVDGLEKYIQGQRNQKCSYAGAYRFCKDKNPQTFEMMVRSLELRGSVVRTGGQKGVPVTLKAVFDQEDGESNEA